MAERLKDKEDLQLEAMFRSDPVPDDGFSVSVVKRVRRQMWIRRLSLPIAVVLGLIIGLRPIIEFIGIASGLVEPLFGLSLSFDSLSIDTLPTASTLILGLSVLMGLMMAGRILEE